MIMKMFMRHIAWVEAQNDSYKCHCDIYLQTNKSD